MKKLCITISVILLFAAGILAGCGEDDTGEPRYARSVAEKAVTSLSDGDYKTYINLFAEEYRDLLTEEDFLAGHEAITEKIGSYVNKTFNRVATEDNYTVVYYDAEFTGEPDVVIRAVFQEKDGEMELAGFWLNSPKFIE